MPKYYGGIDPGKSGGLAIVREDGSLVHTMHFQDNWKLIDAHLGSLSDKPLMLLEHVHAMPRQGVTSMFTFGANFGGWKVLLELAEIPYLLVTPQKWQKAILGSFPKGEGKDRAFNYVSRRFPSLDLKKTRDSGIIDAICMALYIRDNH